MNKQEIFDKVWNHFVVEGNPRSFVNDGGYERCQYRGPNGAKCAIGIFLSDEDYNPGMERFNVSGSYFTTDLIRKIFGTQEFDNDRSFLLSIQRCHDSIGAGYSSLWAPPIKEKLERFAVRHFLRIPEEGETK